jgi:hypothetical protein
MLLVPEESAPPPEIIALNLARDAAANAHLVSGSDTRPRLAA